MTKQTIVQWIRSAVGQGVAERIVDYLAWLLWSEVLRDGTSLEDVESINAMFWGPLGGVESAAARGAEFFTMPSEDQAWSTYKPDWSCNG